MKNGALQKKMPGSIPYALWRSFALYGLLLLLPTLFIGGLLWRLLRDEEVRLEVARREVLADRLRILGDDLQRAVQAAQADMMKRLCSLERRGLAPALLAWNQRDPLVRNVFILRNEKDVVLPDPRESSTREETSFLQRYHALFNNAASWEDVCEAIGDKPLRLNAAMRQHMQKPMQQAFMPGQELPLSGWLPWFADNRLHLLGWVRRKGLTYGLELEMMALLSRLLTLLPRETPSGLGLALLDGDGRILFQRGDFEVSTDSPRAAAVALQPALPHWQLVYAREPNEASGFSGRLAVLGAGVLAMTLLAAILCGGALILWQAQRERREALLKSRFVSNVSHELKTPLTTIRMYAELLSEGVVRDTAKQCHYLRILADESRRLARLVDNVLNFSRLEQNRRTWKLEPTNLHAWLDDWLERQRVLPDKAGMKLFRELDRDAGTFEIDRDALEQVMLNLLGNAVKYAADGGEVTVKLVRGQGRAIVDVLDRGPGVPTGHREKIFRRFYRIDQSLTTEQAGSGLGLSIARGLLRGMRGELHCLAREGGGACFRIVLLT